MEPTNEERTELDQARRARWNWMGVALVGAAVIVLAAFSGSDAGGVALIGLIVAVGGAIMRARATNRMHLIEARLKDRGAIPDVQHF